MAYLTPAEIVAKGDAWVNQWLYAYLAGDVVVTGVGDWPDMTPYDALAAAVSQAEAARRHLAACMSERDAALGLARSATASCDERDAVAAALRADLAHARDTRGE